MAKQNSSAVIFKVNIISLCFLNLALFNVIKIISYCYNIFQASQTLHFSENKPGLEILNNAEDKDQNKNLTYHIDWMQSTATNPSGQQVNNNYLQVRFF